MSSLVFYKAEFYNLYMANGKPGDNPITDLLYYGGHPFPPDIEELVRQLHDLDPYSVNALEYAPMDWERGLFHEPARILLRGLIKTHGDPITRRQIIQEYRDAAKL